MKLKRIDNNLNYTVDIKKFDSVYVLKNKLSSITELNCDEIILIHKNRLLKNDKLISAYNIDKNDFVLFGNEEMNESSCFDKSNQYNKNYFENIYRGISYCKKRKSELENTKLNHLNDDEELFICYSNVRIYALKRPCIDLKCINCADRCVLHSEPDLDVDKTFADYQIGNRETNNLVPRVQGGGSILIKIECITGHYDPFEISAKMCNSSKIINKISEKIKIPEKNIKLFLDKNRSKPIEPNVDLEEYVTNQSQSNTKQVECVNNQPQSNTRRNINCFGKVCPCCLPKHQSVQTSILSQIDTEGYQTETNQLFFNIKTNFEHLVKIEKLGQGSFGTVFKCISIDTKKEFAVKKLEIPSKGKTKEAKLSFERELQVYKNHSDHPHIVKYERYFQTEKAIFLVMEYMQGGSLGSFININGSLSETKIKLCAQQVLEALQYLHDKQILHRDIKSENILLDEDHNVKLCDFGLSKDLIDLATKDFLNGVIQTSVGTVNYMAPEIMNEEPYGPSADVWSFGATMVEMVTGFPPYHDMPFCKVMKTISESKKIKYKYPNDLSGHLKSFIDSCLQSEPSRRSTIEQLMNHSFLTSPVVT